MRWTLEAVEQIPLTPAYVLTQWAETVVIAPHPDDETLGCAGVISLLRAAGFSVTLIVCTDGSRSHPGSRSYPPEKLAQIRRRELQTAAGHLGVPTEQIHFLGLIDAHVPELTSLEGQRASAELHRLCAPAKTVLTIWRDDPHNDHRAVSLYTRAALTGLDVRLLEYPIWLWDNGEEKDYPLRSEYQALRIDVSAVVGRKTAAIASHRSQVSDLVNDLPPVYRLSPAFLAHFQKPWEIFFQAV